MRDELVLASQSAIRAQLLRNANISIRTEAARIDEDAIKEALIAQRAHPRDIADALAEAKARKVSSKQSDVLVLGCDQVLALDREVFSKPIDRDDAVEQLRVLSGQTHRLFSAAVLYEGGQPVWRFVGQVRLTMRNLSDDYVRDYADRNWDSIQHSVGCYKLEEEGARLFTRVDGDYFTVLGLPLLELLSYLITRGTLPS